MTENTKEGVVVEFDPMWAFRNYLPPPEKDPSKKYRYSLVHFNDLQVGPTSPYIVDEVIPRDGIVVAWGPPKCGKSFWIFDLAMHIALGWPYRGREVEQGPVVYCAFEGATRFPARAEAFRRTHDMGPRKISGIEIETRAWFYFLACHTKLVRDHAALIDSIRGQTKAPPTVVVLDTLNRSIDGSESLDKDMGAYLAAADTICDEFSCVVIIVHHCGIDGTRPRGHTSLTGGVAAQIAIKRDAADNIIAEIEAMKDGPEGTTFTSALKMVEVGTNNKGKPITSCAIVETEAISTAAKKGPRLTADQRRFLDILNDAILDAPSEHKTTVGGCHAISREWLKQCCISKGLFDEGEKENARRSKVSRFINSLAGKRCMGANKLYVWPVQ
jgi:hypothetical protein